MSGCVVETLIFTCGCLNCIEVFGFCVAMGGTDDEDEDEDEDQ